MAAGPQALSPQASALQAPGWHHPRLTAGPARLGAARSHVQGHGDQVRQPCGGRGGTGGLWEWAGTRGCSENPPQGPQSPSTHLTPSSQGGRGSTSSSMQDLPLPPQPRPGCPLPLGPPPHGTVHRLGAGLPRAARPAPSSAPLPWPRPPHCCPSALPALPCQGPSSEGAGPDKGLRRGGWAPAHPPTGGRYSTLRGWGAGARVAQGLCSQPLSPRSCLQPLPLLGQGGWAGLGVGVGACHRGGGGPHSPEGGGLHGWGRHLAGGEKGEATPEQQSIPPPEAGTEGS